MNIFLIVLVALAGIAGIVWLTERALGSEKPAGRHALGGGEARRRHARTELAAPQDGADPFADPDDEDPEQAADEYIAALNAPEPEPSIDVEARFRDALSARGLDAEPQPALVLSAPVPEDLEPPLDRRERPAYPVAALPRWEPPANRDKLTAILTALQTWTPAPAVPQEPEPAPEPEPYSVGADTGEIFLGLNEWWKTPAELADDLERKVYGDITPKGSSEDEAVTAERSEAA